MDSEGEFAGTAGAIHYSLRNPYLSEGEKAAVEAIYQTPLAVFDYVFLGYLAFFDASGYASGLVAGAFVSVILALIFFQWPNRAFAVLGTVFAAGWASTIVCLGFAAYLAYQGNWLGFGYAVIAGFGLTAAICPATWTFAHLARHYSPTIHPKYLIAKKLFHVTLPFEGASLQGDTDPFEEPSFRRDED